MVVPRSVARTGFGHLCDDLPRRATMLNPWLDLPASTPFVAPRMLKSCIARAAPCAAGLSSSSTSSLNPGSAASTRRRCFSWR